MDSVLFDSNMWIQGLSVWALPVLLAICMHEAAHGYVAWRLGDDTAKRLGRVSINPLRHIHPVGTVLLPALLFFLKAPFLFGYAKPVPVNFTRLRHPKTDMIWVALAGPGINIFLAVVSAVLLYTVEFAGPYAHILEENLSNSFLINISLAVFNMFPLPPLDGGRIITGILPVKWAISYAKLESYGLFILIGLIFLLPFLGERYGLNLDFFFAYMEIGVKAVAGLIIFLVGGASG